MNFKTKPYKHQLECLTKFWRHQAFALLAEMGTGKTWIIINNAAALWEKGLCDAMLVFAPNGVHHNWIRLEIPKHMPDSVKYYAATWSANARRKEREAIEQLWKVPATTMRIFAMNWEALQNKRGATAAREFAETTENLMIVCDESDSIKNPNAKRTRNLMYLKSFSVWRRIMSGTPVNNSPFDLFSQFRFLDANILRTTSFFAFKNEYAEMIKGGPLIEHIQKRMSSKRIPQIVARGANGLPKYRNLDKLAKLIAPYSFRIRKEECLDLPEKIYKTLFFDLTPKQEKIYKKAEEECRLVFEETETPFDRLVAVTKLSQITSGYYIHPALDEPIRIEGANPKLDLLMDRVKTIVNQGDKIIIWARYRIEIEDIVQRLKDAKIPCVQYHGGVKKKDRVKAIDELEHGATQVFVGNQQAGGRGLTLIGASYVVYFSNSFSYRDRAQSEDRSHRIGQTKNVTYINIAARGTIDEQVIWSLENKKDVAKTIVDKGLELFKNTDPN